MKKTMLILIALVVGILFFSGFGISVESSFTLSITDKIEIIKRNYISDINSRDVRKNFSINNIKIQEIFSVSPEEEWSKTFGDIGWDEGFSVSQTTDGGYIITGETSSYGSGSSDVWLIKTDSDGNMQWNKTYGGTRSEQGESVTQILDGGYIIAGWTWSYGAGATDVWLIKTDSDGNMQWNKTFGYTNDEYGRSVSQTTDGGFIITGFTYQGAGNTDVWLIKTDADGNMQWNKTFGGNWGEQGMDVSQTLDGGYIITGPTDIYGDGYDDVWLIKTDSDGNMQWNKTFDSFIGSTDWGNSVSQTTNGGYIIVGWAHSFTGPDIWLIKTDAKGNKQWDKKYGGPEQEHGMDVSQTLDGGYIIVGRTDSYSMGSFDILLIKTDSNGKKQWEKRFGGSGRDQGQSVLQTLNGGYIIAGWTESYGAGEYDVWLIKVASEMENDDLEITGFSPIDLKVVNAEGFFINKTTCNIPNASYTEEDLDGDGELDDFILIPDALDGLYTIMVIPEQGAEPTDTYSLRANYTGASYYIAKDVMIQDIPPEGYIMSWPDTPSKPDGPTHGLIRETYNFTSSTTDPDGDLVFYLFDWGDGMDSGWVEDGKASHKWIKEGSYEIKVRTRDIHGFKSEWSVPLPVTMPRDKSISSSPLLRFLERYPLLQLLLLQWFGLQ